jgi:hypothetical protein
VNGTSGSSGTTPVGQITGTLTTNKIPKATGTNTLGNSIITELNNAITVSGAAVDNAVATFINTDTSSHGIYVKADGFGFKCEPTSMVGGITLNSDGSASFSGDITANKYIKVGGTSAQYLMADGSVTTGPSLAGYVPYTGATANVNLGVYSLTATGITVAKSAGVSTITFPAGTNDPAFISHTESTANTGIMRFSVGDDDDTIDYFIFGNTVTPDRFRINANGTVSLGTWQATAIADAYIASAATWNAKQNALTNPVTGTGTTNYVPKFTGASTIGNSIVFDNGTNVGIGTASPASKLSVGGNGYTGRAITAIANNADYAITFQQDNASGGGLQMFSTAASWGADIIRISDATTTQLNLKANGNLLVGTTTDAGFKLDVSGTGRFSNQLLLGNFNGEALKFQSSTSTGSTYQRFYNSAGTARGYLGLFWNGSADYMVLDAGATQMNFGSSNSFTFTGGGAATFSSSVTATQVGVNTTTPNAVLEVAGTSANTDFRVSRTVSSSTYFFIKAPGGTPSASTMGVNGTDVMTLNASGNVGIGTATPTQGKLVVSNAGPSVIANRETSVGVNSSWNASDGSLTFFGNESNHPLAFTTNNTERMRITSGGSLEFLGTATGLAGAYFTNNNTNFKIHSTFGGGTTKDLILQSGGSSGAPQLTLKAGGNVLIGT